MTVYVKCLCGYKGTIDAVPIGSVAHCPECGSTLDMEPTADPPKPIEEFLDPPEVVARSNGGRAADEKTSVWPRLLAAILSPVALNALLGVGGGLGVLGAIIWLASLGLFDDPRVLATSLIAGSLAVVVGGVAVSQKTRFQIAGTAITFLGCVLLPLNLWFLHSQHLVTIESGLWVGALICTGVYCLVFLLLRNPILIYAVEIGVTLTLTLLLGALALWTNVAGLSLVLVLLGLLSLHATMLCSSPNDDESSGYGRPLWISGHLQLDAGIVMLLLWQATSFLPFLGEAIFPWAHMPHWTTDARMLPALTWLLAAYVYVFTALQSRKDSAFFSVAGLCVLAAVATFAGPYLTLERAAVLTAAVAAGLQVSAVRSKRLGENHTVMTAVGMLLTFAATGMLIETLMQSAGRLPVLRSLADVEPWVMSSVTVALVYVAAFFALRIHWIAGAVALPTALLGLTVFVANWPMPMGGVELLTTTFWMTASAAVLISVARWLPTRPEQTLWCGIHVLYALLPTVIVLVGRVMFDHGPGREADMVWAGGTVIGTGVAALLAAMLLKHRPEAWVGSFCLVVGTLITLDAVFIPMDYSLLGLAVACTIAMVFLSKGSTSTDTTEAISPQLPTFGALNISQMILVNCGLAVLFRLAGPWLHDDILLRNVIVSGVVAALLAVAAVLAESVWKQKGFLFGSGLLACATLFSGLRMLELTGWQLMELVAAIVGCVVYGSACVTAMWEQDRKLRRDEVTASLWLGCLLAIVPLLITAVRHRTDGGSLVFEEVLLMILATGLLVTGFAWKIKSSTLIAGLAIAIYLVALISSIVQTPELSVGVWLSVFGGSMFVIGVLLSLFRDRLAKIPEQAARHEGPFRYLDWR